MKTFKTLLTFFFLLTLFLSFQGRASEGQWQQRRIYDFQGSLSYQVYIPAQLSASPSVLLALHGCMQSPKAFAAGAGLEEMANDSNAILIVPEQPEISNIYKCWNWFYPHHLKGLGEPYLLAKITRQLKAEYQAEHAFVFGISAGAAMGQILAMCYHDLFTASASHHTLSFGAAMGIWDAQDVFFKGPARSARESAKLGSSCRSFFQDKRKEVPSLIIQGTKGTMSQLHGPTVENQWLIFNDILDNEVIDQSTDLKLEVQNFRPPSLYEYQSRKWLNSQNFPVVEHVIIDGLGHSWSGGDNTYDFNDPHGPSATKMISTFFKNWGL